VLPGLYADAVIQQDRNLFAKLLRRPRIGDGNPRPRSAQEQRAGHAGLSQPDHQHAFALTSIDFADRATTRHCPTFLAHLTQLQRGESKECKHQRRDPEANNHLGLAPAQQLKVVVDGRHLEDAFLRSLYDPTCRITDSASITNIHR